MRCEWRCCKHSAWQTNLPSHSRAESCRSGSGQTNKHPVTTTHVTRPQLGAKNSNKSWSCSLRSQACLVISQPNYRAPRRNNSRRIKWAGRCASPGKCMRNTRTKDIAGDEFPSLAALLYFVLSGPRATSPPDTSAGYCHGSAGQGPETLFPSTQSCTWHEPVEYLLKLKGLQCRQRSERFATSS